MEYIPLIALCVSSVLSAIAIVISVLSLRNSRRALRSSEDAQLHTQIVTYEQRKQEVRQLILEQSILNGEIDAELSRIPDSIWLREKISQVAIIRDRTENTLKNFDAIPSSPSTDARLTLEQLGGHAIWAHKSLQTFLKVLRDYRISHESG
jgi:hypothetical protein